MAKKFKRRSRMKKTHAAVFSVIFGIAGSISLYLAYAAPKSPPAAPASSPSSSFAFKVNGAKEIVYNHDKDNCDTWDIPDLPAHAYRNYQGKVVLYLSSGGSSAIPKPNYLLIGSDLNHLTHFCTPVFQSNYNHDHSKYDDRQWIAGGYTQDGKTFYNLMHQENHAEGISGCIEKTHNCQYDSVNLATSTDGGLTFHESTPPDQLVASAPYTFDEFRLLVSQGKLLDRFVGYGVGTNIIKKDGYYYSIISGIQQPTKYPTSACLIRTTNLSNPTSWKGWDGSGFNVQFVNPYTNNDPPDSHICAALDYDNIGRMAMSLTYSTYFKKYVLFGIAGTSATDNTQKLFYSFSDDLIHWTLRKELTGLPPLTFNANCHTDAEDPVLYPSLIDPTSTSRNFDTVGNQPYIYLTQLHYGNRTTCSGGPNRDLIRYQLLATGGPAPSPSTSPGSTSKEPGSSRSGRSSSKSGGASSSKSTPGTKSTKSNPGATNSSSSPTATKPSPVQAKKKDIELAVGASLLSLSFLVIAGKTVAVAILGALKFGAIKLGIVKAPVLMSGATLYKPNVTPAADTQAQPQPPNSVDPKPPNG